MPMSPAEYTVICEFVLGRSGIDLEPGKEYLVDTRLTPLLKRLGLPGMGELIGVLKDPTKGAIQKEVVEAMTTNETSFFRDIHPFEALKTKVLPDLIARRAADKRLNIWCAASSSGQEPYTIAMVIKEHFPELANWQMKFIATDISREMIDKCRAGMFSQLEVNRGLPAPLLLKYFKKVGPAWQINEPLRNMVEFREFNLLDEPKALPPLDVVFIRNVLIYFNAETKKGILGRIRKLLRPDGYMFLGGAETTMNLDDNFERVQIQRSGCYQLKQAAGIGAAVVGSQVVAARAA
jgi:chemotaxis protein methyltransferase CheR